MIPKFTIHNYAEFSFIDEGVVRVSSPNKERESALARSLDELKLNSYDPRTGQIEIHNPKKDKYSMCLWCLQLFQELKRAGREVKFSSKEIDFSEVIHPPELEDGVSEEEVKY